MTSSPAELPTRSISVDMARTFVAICETRNFRHAADRVNRSPSAVSLQIGKLETLLGCALFYRDARRVTPTEKGAEFLGYARQLVRVNDDTIARFRGSALSGTLRLAAPHDLGVTVVPQLLKRFAGTHPNIRVDVRLDSSATIQEIFAAGEANTALFSEQHTTLASTTELYSQELCWLGAVNGQAALERPLPIAVAGPGCAWRDAAIAALDDAGLPYRVAYSSDTSMGQMAAVRADLAIAALPKAMIDGSVCALAGLPSIGRCRMFLAQDATAHATAFAHHICEYVSQNATMDTVAIS